MNFLYKIFKQDSAKREDVVVVTSAVGILVNVLIALVKITIGIAVSSIAIISEGVNNATDAVTALLTIAGTKLSNKMADEKHPFGYGRIEYLTGLVISSLILISGYKLLKSSIILAINPEKMNISYITIVIVAFSGVIKLLLGTYTVKTGKRVESTALVAVGKECRNDSFVSAVTVLSSIVFLVFSYSLDAYVGIFTSLIVIKTGLETLKETLDEILGRPGKKELATALYKKIRSADGILNAADLMLHNYGPEKYSGSVNIEIDHKKEVGEVYKQIHKLQLDIMHEYGVTIVFGIYAVDNDSAEGKKIRSNIAAFVRNEEYVKSYHAVYIDKTSDTIYCDFVVDYKLKDTDNLKNRFAEYIKNLYPNHQVELVIETEFI